MDNKQHIVLCKHCGEKTIPREESVFEGWTKVGINRFCTLCGGVLDGSETAVSAAAALFGEDVPAGQAADAFAKLFGTEKPSTPDVTTILGAAAETLKAADYLNEQPRFCRDCKDYIKHAFHNRCGRTNQEVGPMDDCPDFEPRETNVEIKPDFPEGTIDQ